MVHLRFTEARLDDAIAVSIGWGVPRPVYCCTGSHPPVIDRKLTNDLLIFTNHVQLSLLCASSLRLLHDLNPRFEGFRTLQSGPLLVENCLQNSTSS